MHNRQVFAVLLAGAISASAIAIAAAAPSPVAPTAPTAPRAGAPAAPTGAPAAPASGAPAGRGAAPAAGAAPAMVVLEFKPLFDDLMTMLIQPRHIKLWAAGQQQNWTLAAFELNELRTAFDRIAATIPKDGPQNVNLGPTFISMMSGPIMTINGAINAKNLQQFNTAYLDLTNTCTSCHQALNHPYLVIKVPDATALANYADQDFRPAPVVK